ncbi:MAG: hypothetical protein ACRENP_13575 [Longimicrobiales bacterium]
MEKINWNTELRRIEREFDGLPPEPTPEEVSIRRAAEQRAQEQAERARELREDRYLLLSIWARLALVGVLGVAVAFWPYGRACGFGLFVYMFVGVVIVLGGLWASIFGWHYRLPWVHGLALALVLWGLILITAQFLPRIGYARVDPNHPPTWMCRR